MADSGVCQMLERRCVDAGIPSVHPHLLRHTFAHDWLATGGQEHDLMRRSVGARGRWSGVTPPLRRTDGRGTRTGSRPAEIGSDVANLRTCMTYST